MSYYAILHSSDPGPHHYDNILSAEHKDVFLNATLDERGLVVRSNKLHFEVTRSLPFGHNPVFVTVWDGPKYLVTVAVPINTHLNKGDWLDVDLDWTTPYEGMKQHPLTPN